MNPLRVLLLCLFAVTLTACALAESSAERQSTPEPGNGTAVARPTVSPTAEMPLAQEPAAESGNKATDAQPVLPLADYPPSSTPYRIEDSDLWLVHTLAGQLIAFAPFSPDYNEQINVEECRFEWQAANLRFADPCSGDEWELTGQLNLAESSELWSTRNLDQYPLSVVQEKIFVQMHSLTLGQAVPVPILASDAQFGITVTAVTANFSPDTTLLDALIQVDPVWGLDPSAFPPQQALSYPTFPDSLFDEQGHSISSGGREGSLAVVDAATGGLQQTMHHHWDAVPAAAEVVTAMLTVDVSHLHRELSLPLAWSAHQAGDTWTEAIPLEMGYAAALIQQVEWLETLADGRARLRFTVSDASPEGIDLTCLHLDTEDLWQQSCANFEGEQTYTIITPPGEPVALHLRAGLTVVRPFQLVLTVTR